MGIGKSTFLDTVIRKMQPESTMLAITFRQTLALERARKLKDDKFVSYRNVPPEEPMDSREEFPRVI